MSNKSKKQVELSDFIKSVHAKLRGNYYLSGNADAVWKKHCLDTKLLDSYSKAMQQLADIWKENESCQCRIQWCHSVISDYFTNNGFVKAVEKDSREKIYKSKNSVKIESSLVSNMSMNGLTDSLKRETINVLDVGSCFNPLKAFKELSVIAIDIAPAFNDVYCCDFLEITVKESPDEEKDKSSQLTHLVASSFDVVVFSLFLEYLPSPRQRWQCCHKAHNLLTMNGLLLIITPDSHAVHRNAHLMRDWKNTLGNMGFKRWRYEKLEHVHCMAFRKLSSGNIEEDGVLYIPQDLTLSMTKPTNVVERTEEENRSIGIGFSNLPDFKLFD